MASDRGTQRINFLFNIICFGKDMANRANSGSDVFCAFQKLDTWNFIALLDAQLPDFLRGCIGIKNESPETFIVAELIVRHLGTPDFSDLQVKPARARSHQRGKAADTQRERQLNVQRFFRDDLHKVGFITAPVNLVSVTFRKQADDR